jgi:hypothetical protein
VASSAAPQSQQATWSAFASGGATPLNMGIIRTEVLFLLVYGVSALLSRALFWNTMQRLAPA